MMEPGQYVLSRDVQNPHPDRRQRYDWRTAVTWPKGQEFTVTEDLTAGDTKALVIRPTWGRWSHMTLYLHDTEDGRVPALLAALEPAPRTGARDLKALLGPYGSRDMMFSVVAKLLDSKVLDIEQVRAALDLVEAESNDVP